jgi:hypothetical protein
MKKIVLIFAFIFPLFVSEAYAAESEKEEMCETIARMFYSAAEIRHSGDTMESAGMALQGYRSKDAPYVTHDMITVIVSYVYGDIRFVVAGGPQFYLQMASNCIDNRFPFPLPLPIKK